MDRTSLHIPKVWRSEIGRLSLFFLLSMISVVGSNFFPFTVLSGEVAKIGEYRLMVSFPLLWIFPLLVLGQAMYRIQNVRYSLDARGIEARVGILALNQRVTRVRFEDVRSVETEQTFVERILDVGQVEISTASTGGIEIVFEGVGAPFEVRDLIERERDTRLKVSKRMALEREQNKRSDEEKLSGALSESMIQN